MEYSLKWLCKEYKNYSSDRSFCCNLRSEYLRRNKGSYHFEELDESDIVDLRPYLLCDILAIYEYLAIKDKVKTQSWFQKYKGVSCRKEDADDYIELRLSPIAPENADDIFESMLNKSIEPFKSRGIPASCFDYTV